MARASKIFFQKPIEVESLKGKLEHAKRPAIICCEKKKQINKPAWTILSVLQRTLDCALQEIQFTHPLSL